MIFRLLLSLFGRRGGSRRHDHEAQLRAMSDSELADLGIGRSQIPSLLCEDEVAVIPGLTRNPSLERQHTPPWIAGQARNDKAFYIALNKCA